jgi:hypothetical protein
VLITVVFYEKPPDAVLVQSLKKKNCSLYGSGPPDLILDYFWFYSTAAGKGSRVHILNSRDCALFGSASAGIFIKNMRVLSFF